MATIPDQVSYADMELMLDKHMAANMYAKGVDRGGTAYDQYIRPGTFLDAASFKKYTESLIEHSYKSMGHGSDKNLLQNFVSRLDRHGRVIVPMNHLNYGYTFITRPRLNLSGANLSMDPLLSGLYDGNPKSISFMIRALLDTRLCTGQRIFGNRDSEATDFWAKASLSGLVDTYNPFLVPVCNALKGISGFPDFVLETETTDGDFYSADYTYARGSDMNQRGTELSLEFRDTPGSIILAIFYYWIYYTALQCRGVVEAYQDDIYEGLLNYTFSIYRFVTDHSRRRIHHWAKATGCIVKSVPIGSIFNVSQGETFITSATNFSIPVAVNKIEYNKPDILRDFNTLMQRYCPHIDDESVFYSMANRGTADFNFMGLPFITIGSNNTSIEMDWRTATQYYDNLATIDRTSEATEGLYTSRNSKIEGMSEDASINNSVLVPD